MAGQPPTLSRHMPLSLARLEEMREEAMAEDVEIDLIRMQHWSEERATLCARTQSAWHMTRYFLV